MMSHRIFSATLTLGLIFEETVDLGGGTVVGANGVTLVGGVKDQVLAHDGQTDQTEISTGQRTRWSADIDAGETGAFVSCQSSNVNKTGRKGQFEEIGHSFLRSSSNCDMTLRKDHVVQPFRRAN